MNNSNQPVTKEKAIKIFLIIVLGTIIFAVVGMYLGYGKLPDKNFLITMAILLPFMAMSAIIGYQHRQQINGSNQSLTEEKVSRKSLIKLCLAVALFIIILVAVQMYLGNSGASNKTLLIALSMVLSITAVIAIIGYKYLPQILQVKNKLAYFCIFVGLGSIIINGILILIRGGEFNYYLQVIVGFSFLFFGIKQIKKKS